MSITVTLNTANKPPVTVSPNPFDVASKGLQSLTWVPATGQTFEFVSLTFSNNPSAFSVPSVAKAAISVNDTNNNIGASTSYPYTIVVSLNGVNYSSAATGIGGTGGTPTIRNT
ncbi:MAG: hypothetical protein ACHP7D_02415 [Lysobacterales bacterium]